MASTGIHLPNRHLRDGELTEVLALNCQAYVLFVVDPGSDVEVRYWAAIATEIKRRIPGAQVHVRIERRGELTPNQDAKIVTRVAGAFGASADSLCIRNEPQLESPGVSPNQWGGYLHDFTAALPEHLRLRVAIPPLCPEIGLEEWLAVSVGYGRDLGLMWAHVYGDRALVTARLATIRRYWRGRLVVTEWNYGAGNAVNCDAWAAVLPGALAAARDHKADALCAFIWEWDRPDMALPTSVNICECPSLQAAIRGAALADASPVEEDQTMSEYPSPNHGDKRKQTLGVIVHSTRSDKPISLDEEYRRAREWLCNPASEVSAHTLVGPKPDMVARLVDPDDEAYHAREHNATHLAIELVQPKLGVTIPDITWRLAAREVAGWCVRYYIPIAWSTTRGIAEHREMPAGIREGKSDILCPIDRLWFLDLVKQEARALAPKPALVVGELRAFPEWALGRLAHSQDFRGAEGRGSFCEHLAALGCDSSRPERYGWPDG